MSAKSFCLSAASILLFGVACTESPVDEVTWAVAPGVTIDRVAMYQGIERDLALDGDLVEDSEVPLIAGRPGLVRVFYTVDDDYDGESVIARLDIGDRTYESEPTDLEDSSEADDLDSTVNLSLEVGDLPEGEIEWSIELVQEGDFDPGEDARYPAEGTVTTEVEGDVNVLRVVLAPFSYDFDGSGRLPVLDEDQVERIRRYFHNLYPVSDVEITVREPTPFATRLGPDGSGWFNAGLALVALRNDDGASDDVYYYGIFNPTDTIEQFCSGGCLLGVTLLNDSPADEGSVQLRIAIGVGYESRAADVAAHELGHAHGRSHAPCGPPGNMPDGLDPRYPYDGGVIGVWGYDFYRDELVDPDQSTDIMGYCDDLWISDYQYRALHERGRHVNVGFGSPVRSTWDVVAVDGQGVAIWGGEIDRTRGVAGHPVDVEVVDADGSIRIARGAYTRWDHIPGGLLLVPRAHLGRAPAAAAFDLDGRRLNVRR
jgi:hypothetical protein